MHNVKWRIILGAFAFIQLLACKKSDSSPTVVCSDEPKPSDTYVYPIRPGTVQWSNLTSGDEQLKACQIPDSVLSNISTEGLIQSWLDFPLTNEILLSNSVQRGIEFFIANFSGLKELCKRKDAGDKLFERYKKMDPLCIDNFTSDSAKGFYTFTFTYVEMLLGQDTILNKLTASQKKLLVSEALNKYDSKNKYEVYFGFFGAANSMFVCGKAMQNSLYQPFLTEVSNSPLLLEFLNSFLLPADKTQAYQLTKNILNHSFNFIK